MSRDLRDPIKLGERYLMLRKKGVDIDVAVEIPVGNYEEGPWMSSKPHEHHKYEFFSNLPKDAGDLSE